MQIALACLGLAVSGLLGLALDCILVRRRRHRPLRRCPVCGGDAISSDVRSAVDGAQVQVALRCGQCGMWRRLLTTQWALREYDRELDEDRRAIGSCLARLQVERTLRG